MVWRRRKRYGLNVLVMDLPGAGRTWLACPLPGILPKMSFDEALDVTRVYSVADQPPTETPIIQQMENAGFQSYIGAILMHKAHQMDFPTAKLYPRHHRPSGFRLRPR